MKPSYKNYIPKWLVILMRVSSVAVSIEFLIYVILILINYSKFNLLIAVTLGIGGYFLMLLTKKIINMRNAFDYNNPNSISWDIINFVVDKLEIKEDARILDIGCGNGVLAIAIAKKYPNSKIIAVDNWKDFSKRVSKEKCEQNAKIEGVKNIEFIRADIKKLDFTNETFDAVISNYAYYNISGERNIYLYEGLRVLKKGGIFLMHDLFLKIKFPHIEVLMDNIHTLEYEKVELIDTTDGNPISSGVSKKLMLNGSKLFFGKK